jgi:hypothetical protein
MVIIRFAKGKNGKPPTLTCTRDDGSATWQTSSDFFIRHDLIHYSIETTLGYRQAFFGLIAGGRGIQDFGTRNGVKDNYTQEAGWAEGLAGMIQFPIETGTPLTSEECLAWVRRLYADYNQSGPDVTTEQIEVIRARITDLHARWDALPEGAALELSF